MREDTDFLLIERVEQILEILCLPLFASCEYFFSALGNLQLYNPSIFIGSLSCNM